MQQVSNDGRSVSARPIDILACVSLRKLFRYNLGVVMEGPGHWAVTVEARLSRNQGKRPLVLDITGYCG